MPKYSKEEIYFIDNLALPFTLDYYRRFLGYTFEEIHKLCECVNSQDKNVKSRKKDAILEVVNFFNIESGMMGGVKKGIDNHDIVKSIREKNGMYDNILTLEQREALLKEEEEKRKVKEKEIQNKRLGKTAASKLLDEL